MGPKEIKDDIYNVMTNSRELTNYCQESVKSLKSKKISDSLKNFHLEEAAQFITKTLIDNNQLMFESNDIKFNLQLEFKNKQVHSKAIDYIQSYFGKFNSLI